MRFDYEDGFITQSYARMTFVDENGETVDEARVNYPARHGGKSFLMVRGGHAVRIAAASDDGVALLPESVTRLGESAGEGYADRVELADGRELTIVTTADAGDPAGAASEVLRLVDPAVTFSLTGTPGDVTLRPGQSARLGDVTVALGDVRLWNEFAVRSDRGIPVTCTAFGVILLGTVLRLAYGKRSVSVLAASGQVWAWGSDKTLVDRARAVLSDDVTDPEEIA